jgi:predicted GNAT family acetyltransferase
VTAGDLVVRDVPGASRYEARAGDEVAGFTEYVVTEGPSAPVVVFTHTEVDPAFEGQGVGGTLVRGALDEVRRRGAAVQAQCPFVRAWIERHPDYQDLVVR